MAKRLVVFNHKGGVSKTTSAYNIGWMMSKSSKVLLVDADPQCNLSGLILGDDFERYYIEKTTRKQNIKDGVAPAFSGKPTPIEAVDCVSPKRAPNLYLLAGHANLSEYDASLTFAQTSNNALSVMQNLPGAFARLMELTEEKYNIDYTIIDLNPGLSAINQNLFISSDAFIVPTNPDPFSLMALDTLKVILPRWVNWKLDSKELFEDSAYPLTGSVPKFLGSLVQRFNIRKGKAARPYQDNIDEINDRVSTDLVRSLRRSDMMLEHNQYPAKLIDNKFCLGQIPDFQGLLPKSYNAGVPVFALKNSEIRESGPILNGLKEKREMFKEQFTEISAMIVEMMKHA
ncbi:AAA family ATPase [Methylobacterium sp. EM32]|uniref:ParA family protein n=1 Tax=Methylobacterium sp. EM32 TaxID=3163481 RepID=UPI0033BCA5D3